MLRVLALAAFLLLLPTTASATFDGTTGKVAYIDTNDGLYIDDPFDDQPAQGPLATVASKDPINGLATMPHPPAWSPDGTLLAYTALIPDTFGLKHTAVFVMKADGTGARQVSDPFALAPDTCPGQCNNGHQAFDIQPTWTPDGKIAFIRQAFTGDDSPRVSERGSTVRVVNPAGGGETARYYLEAKSGGLMLSLVWPTSSIHPFAVIGDKPDKSYSIRNLGTNHDIVSAPAGIIDLDASPVGQKLAYATLVNGPRVQVIDFAGRPLESFGTGLEHPQIRFTPDGNGIARTGCARDRAQRQHCGIVTHRLDDPDGDVRPEDPVERPLLDMQGGVRLPAWPAYRGNFDIQSQDLPIVLIPGFLGSEIECDGERVWMTLPPLVMRPMALSADGRTNQNCASAKATGKPVDTFLTTDVYEHLDKWLERLDPPAGGASFGWDWRRAPQDSLDELEEKIDELLAASELAQAQGVERVALAAHSYGGVLMRLFINDETRSRKVARMLNVGVPMWGSIKPFFPLVFGIEGIGMSALDAFVENEDLKDTMRNFPGAYHLLAGDNFGHWLTVDGAMLGQDGVKGFLGSQGGNGVLFEDARVTHRDGIDGWLDYDGRIDVRTVVGVGYLTTHRVDLTMSGDEADVEVFLGDGDITVPRFSARQQKPGGAMMGDPIHIQERCGWSHMDQLKDLALQQAYTQFMLFGRTPRKLPEANCEASGDVIQFSKDLEIPPPISTEDLAADSALTLGQADWEGKADVIDLPGGTQVVVNDVSPVALKVAAEGLSFTVTDVDGSSRGRTVTYGPLTGELVVEPSASDVPIVKVDGKPVAPTHDTGGGKEDRRDDEVTPPPPPPPSLTASLTGGRVKLSRAGVATIAARLDGGTATGTITLTAKLGRRTIRIGSTRVSLPAGRTVKARIKVSKPARRAAARRALRATATLSVPSTAPARAVVRLRSQG